MIQNQHQLPEGWDEKRVRDVITYYERQTENAAVAEGEAAFAEYAQGNEPHHLNTMWAIVRNGRIELLEKTNLQEGTKLLVTFLPDEEARFWTRISESAADAIWDRRRG